MGDNMITLQFKKEWKAPPDALGSYQVFPPGLSIEMDDDSAIYLAAAGYGIIISDKTPEIEKAVAVVAEVIAEFERQNLAPSYEAVTIALALQAEIEKGEGNGSTESATPDAPEAARAAATLIAKTTKACELTIDGKLQKFRKGVSVYDALARQLIDAGLAVETAAEAVA
jgi:hypothetical protein